jgi:hypothetical protein
MTCTCGHDDHAWTDPTVCSDLNCKCENFTEATPENPVPVLWKRYVDEMGTLQEKIGWLLENVIFLRNYNNTGFIDWFRKSVDNKSPESIIRAKRKLVELDYGKYGPFDAPELEMQKQLKQVGIKEWLVQ